MIRPSSYRAGGGLELAPAVLLITRTVLIIMVIITTVDAGASSGSLLAAPDATSASQNNRQLLNHLPDGFQCAIETCWAEHLDNGELLQDRICCRASYDGNNCPVGYKYWTMCGPPNQHCCQLDHTIPASDLFVRLINPLKSSLAGVVADYAGTGRLEVFYNNEWGTVCDDDFGDKEALAFCKKLGFRYGAKIATPASQQGSGRIWLDAVDCDVSPGGTGDLSKCITRNGWGKNDCAHDEDVVLACSNDARVPVGAGIRGTAIRLAGPDAASGYGRLEVNYNEVWGTVCDDEFGLEEAGAFCRSLGFSGGGVIASPTPASLQGSGQIFMDSVDCSSNSEPASSCTHNGWGRHDCDHAEDVVLRCFRASPPPPPPAQPSFKTIAYTDCLSGPSCSQVVFDVANTPSYTYDAARQYCASVGGTLASIRSAAEQEFLKSQLLDASSPTGFWIGLYNPGIPSTSRSAFQWLDGWSVSYTNWQLGEPNNNANAQGKCVQLYGIRGDAVWDDDGCEQPKRAICSRRLPPPSPSPTPAPTGLVELVVTFTAGPLDRRTYAQRCSNFTKGVKVWWAKTASTRLRYHMMSSMTNRPPFTECLRNFPGPGQYQRRLYVSNTTPEEVYDAFRNQATSFAKLTLKPVCSYVPLNVGTANCGNCFASFSVRVNSLPELRFDQTNLYSPLSCFEV